MCGWMGEYAWIGECVGGYVSVDGWVSVWVDM